MFSNQTFFYTLFILCQEEIIPLHTSYPHFRNILLQKTWACFMKNISIFFYFLYKSQQPLYDFF